MAKKKAFLLRMQPEVWEEISRWAADELRSVNGHIEYLLRQALIEKRRADPEKRRRGRQKPQGGE